MTPDKGSSAPMKTFQNETGSGQGWFVLKRRPFLQRSYCLKAMGEMSSVRILRHSVERPMPSSRAISVTRP